MEAKHTPGPWKVDKELTSRSGEWLIAVDAGDKWRGIAIAETRVATGAELANARLLASAPELLMACQAMIEWDDREQDHAVDFSARMELCRVAFDKARAAIAKATQPEKVAA